MTICKVYKGKDNLVRTHQVHQLGLLEDTSGKSLLLKKGHCLEQRTMTFLCKK
jgi:hypothetical protein